MRKQPLIFGVMLVLITVGLSGCTDSNNGGGTTNKFVGTWVNLETAPTGWYDKLTIYEDGLASLMHYTSDGEASYSATWEVDTVNSMITFNTTSFQSSWSYYYSYTNDDTLVLTVKWDEVSKSMTYKKS